MKRHIPNILTLFNLAAGFAAIIQLNAGRMDNAIILVAFAMVFDFADGFAARMLNAYSPLGKELDSLADMVTFGVVPGYMAYNLISISMNFHPGAPLWLPYISVIIPLFSALRLAKFNIDTEQTDFFRGLPTPANAFMIISLAAMAVWDRSPVSELLVKSTWAIVTIVTISSILMVTRLPLLSLKIKKFTLEANKVRLVLILLWGSAVLFFGLKGMVLIIPVYLLVSVASGSE